jgi:transposase
VNKDMYIDIIHLLRGAVGKKRRETWRINSWFLLHDNAPAHRSVLVKVFFFLAKSSVTTLENPPYPSDMAPTDFYLFARLKSALKSSTFVMLMA